MTIENSWCVLDISSDGMSAHMSMRMPEGEEGFLVSAELVKDLLKAQNITAGIQEAAIHAMIENVMYGQSVCVAEGKPATRGADGYFVFEKDTQDMKKQPLVLENGSVDYKNSFQLATIKEGELLATYVPAGHGECGYDIYGKVKLALGPGKELLPLRGKGINADEEKKHFYAAYDGHIVMEGKSVSIEKLYRVSGDLNIEVGNIRFDGDVEVSGDMRSGMEIECKGDVFIHGHVGACRIVAGQNITIEKGIQGRDSCEIRANGDVTCRFIERANIFAGRNIYADSVLNSRLIANEKVIVTTKSGSIVGSEVYGMTGVVVKEAGNSAGTPTLLRAGLPRQEYVRAIELEGEIKQIEEKVAAFNEHLDSLATDNSEKAAEIRTQIMRAKIVLDSKKHECSEELERLKTRISENGAKATISVLDTSYSGVRIYIGAKPFIVTESVKEVTYVANSNEILAEALDENVVKELKNK